MTYFNNAGTVAGCEPVRASFERGKFFGLFELDSAGTVLYSRIETDDDALAPPDVTGQNFYTQVAPFRNFEEFRQQVECFSRSTQPASSFDFKCEYKDGPLTVRVLLARIRERSQQDVTRSVLVHIRKVR